MIHNTIYINIYIIFLKIYIYKMKIWKCIESPLATKNRRRTRKTKSLDLKQIYNDPFQIFKHSLHTTWENVIAEVLCQYSLFGLYVLKN